MTDFKTWFEQKYIDWIAKRGRRGSLREFSEWLGVSQSIVANWMGGHRKPGPEYAAIDVDPDHIPADRHTGAGGRSALRYARCASLL